MGSQRPDAELTAALVMAAEARSIAPGVGRVWTTDAIFREMGWKVRQYGAAGILAVEMELAALLAVAQVRGVAARGRHGDLRRTLPSLDARLARRSDPSPAAAPPPTSPSMSRRQ